MTVGKPRAKPARDLENFEVARMLSEFADLLDIDGANPFRVRAYRNAVRTIEGLTDPVAAMVAAGEDLAELPAIGKDLAAAIAEIVATGRLSRLGTIARRVPTGLLALLDVESIGPKRARILHEQLGIASLPALGQAVASGRLAGVAGFGPKSISTIARALGSMTAGPPRMRLADAERVALPLLEHLRAAPGVISCDVAGSLRRRRETVGDIDFVASSRRPADVIRSSCSAPDARRTVSAGTTRATIELGSGLRADLRVVEPNAYGAALHYLTGSKSHGIALRTMAMARGLKLNEYGVFRVGSGDAEGRIAGRTEKEVIRVYLPPDANTLLSVTDHCLRSRHYVNVVIAGKQPAPQWLTMDEAIEHCAAGIGIWEWAGSDQRGEPDVVMACCGDVPTLETLAAVSVLREHLPEIKVRVINVVDLMKLQSPREHPHGMSDQEFDALFTRDRPIIFAFHGYPGLIHRLTYRRTNHGNLHVHGFKEEGTATTPFDMTVLNELDRFHLAGAVVDRLPQLGARAAPVLHWLREKLTEHRAHVERHGVDLAEVNEWRWMTAR